MITFVDHIEAAGLGTRPYQPNKAIRAGNHWISIQSHAGSYSTPTGVHPRDAEALELAVWDHADKWQCPTTLPALAPFAEYWNCEPHRYGSEYIGVGVQVPKQVVQQIVDVLCDAGTNEVGEGV